MPSQEKLGTLKGVSVRVVVLKFVASVIEYINNNLPKRDYLVCLNLFSNSFILSISLSKEIDSP